LAHAPPIEYSFPQRALNFMPTRIITIEREYGSGGALVAEKLANRLGWRLWDTALTAEIARLADVSSETVQTRDEKLDPWLYRLAKVFARGSYERSLPVEGISAFDTDRMVQLVTRVIEDAASMGNCVVVGRGSPYILRNRPDVFHVFVYAPTEDKIRFLRANGHPEEEAVELVNTIDRDRAAFVKQYFGKDWPSRCLYNLWINASIGVDAVVEIILNAVATRDRISPDKSLPGS
jgi:cytidylate kinase